MEVGPSFLEMRRLISGFSATIAISAVADLGIADYLSEGPQTSADLARLTGVDEQVLGRVLRYLASERVFKEHDGDAYALTERSGWLRRAGHVRPY